MVHFRDKLNPATARTIQNIVSVNGECEAVCLVGITITRTDAPITVGIMDQLPWLGDGYAMSRIGTAEAVDPKVSGGGKPGELYNQDFSTEIDWSSE